MNCPNCGHNTSLVLRTDPATQDMIRRRRECCLCFRRWTTYEMPANVVEEHSQMREALNAMGKWMKI